MEITEVRVKLTEDSDDRLQAFCSVTFDDSFVVRDLKIIEGANGPFVAMPSRKLTSHCQRCGCKNHLRAAYCNQCGGKLNPDRAVREQDGRAKLYADIAHPINSQCRELIQQRVIAEYHHELELAKQPGYVPRYSEDFDEDFSDSDATARQTESGKPSEIPSGPTERTQIEPAANEPRAPHKTPGKPEDTERTPVSPHSSCSKKDSFGAGILDE